MKDPKELQIVLLKEILEEVKDVKKIEKNNSRHLERHSNMINYAQTMLKTLWDERLIKEKEDKENKKEELNESKDKIEKLRKILITISVGILLAAIGINNIPEAITKLIGVL